ncbi:PEGA domain-containing protein [bacterium]|nr:PEGA domain-containing protein [bacterium]
MKRSKLFQIGGLLLVTMVFVWGCATIISGTTQDLSVGSTPAGASVKVMTLAGMEMASGTTPFTATLSRNSSYKVVVSMKGYMNKEVIINKGFNVMTIGNIICGGIPGLIIDYISGAIFELNPDQIMVSLEGGSSMNNSDVQLVIYTMNDKGEIVKHFEPLVKELPVMTEQQ